MILIQLQNFPHEAKSEQNSFAKFIKWDSQNEKFVLYPPWLPYCWDKSVKHFLPHIEKKIVLCVMR